MNVVYFIQRADGLIKIGTTRELGKRVAALQRNHGIVVVLRTINGGTSRERAIHARLGAHREYGEWFRPHEEVLAALMSEDNGELVPITRRNRQTWSEREAESVKAAASCLSRAVVLRRQRCGVTQEGAIAGLESDYGFPKYYLRCILHEKVGTVTAHGVASIRAALKQELELLIEDLKTGLAAAEASQPLEATAAKAKSRRLIKRGRG